MFKAFEVGFGMFRDVRASLDHQTYRYIDLVRFR